MLRNDVIDAILRDAPGAPAEAMRLLAADCPDDEALLDFALLVGAIQDRALDAFIDHDHAQLARVALAEAIEPAARRRLGQPACDVWIASLWRNLAHRAAGLGFSAECSDDHAAPLWLRAADWRAAADAVAAIASWRHIPAPLGWMTEARFRLNGLDSAWPLLAELAWLSPERLGQVMDRLGDSRLERLRKRFDADFESDSEYAAEAGDGPGSGATTSASELAWFPAWALTEQPALAALLAQAQPGNERRPERALRLMVALLHLERQGRHNDIVQRRKALRELHPGLYAAYLKTR